MENDVFHRIRDIISSGFGTPATSEIEASTTLKELSLKNPDILLEFAGNVAEEFGVFFSDKQVFDWNTVHDVVQSTQDTLLASSAH